MLNRTTLSQMLQHPPNPGRELRIGGLGVAKFGLYLNGVEQRSGNRDQLLRTTHFDLSDDAARHLQGATDSRAQPKLEQSVKKQTTAHASSSAGF